MFTLLATPIHITQWLSDQVKLLQEAMVLNNTTGALRCCVFNIITVTSNPCHRGLWQMEFTGKPSIQRWHDTTVPNQVIKDVRRVFSRVCKVQRHYSPSKGGLSGNKTGHRFILDSSLRGWAKDHVFFLLCKNAPIELASTYFVQKKHTEKTPEGLEASLWPGWRSDFKMTTSI